MSDDVQKLRTLAQLTANPPDGNDISLADFAAKLMRVLHEPEIGDIRVKENGYGTIVVNGAVCAVLPMAKLKAVHAQTHELVLDALHDIQKDIDADRAFNDAY